MPSSKDVKTNALPTIALVVSVGVLLFGNNMIGNSQDHDKMQAVQMAEIKFMVEHLTEQNKLKLAKLSVIEARQRDSLNKQIEHALLIKVLRGDVRNLQEKHNG